MRKLADLPTTRNAPTRFAVAAVALAAACAAGCGGGQGQGSAATTRPERTFAFSPGEGRLVDIGGHRSLRLWCSGAGSPTVVVSAGVIDRSATVRDQLARTTRTCAYDRAGEGYSSDPARVPTDARDDLQDLEALLRHAHLRPPYVPVGVSYAGPVAALFAKAHPRETAGVVLIESVGADFRRRFLALGRGEPARVRRRLAHDVGPRVTGGLDEDAIAAELASVRTLGHTPLAVVGTPFAHAAPPAVHRAAARLWMTLQDEQAALSRDHLHVVATRTGEFVMDSQPEVVVAAVRAVVHAARSGTPLPACHELVREPGVVCRG